VTVEAKVPPKGGFMVNSSAFALEHSLVLKALKQ
jgi:hypothetical protein